MCVDFPHVVIVACGRRRQRNLPQRFHSTFDFSIVAHCVAFLQSSHLQIPERRTLRVPRRCYNGTDESGRGISEGMYTDA